MTLPRIAAVKLEKTTANVILFSSHHLLHSFSSLMATPKMASRGRMLGSERYKYYRRHSLPCKRSVGICTLPSLPRMGSTVNERNRLHIVSNATIHVELWHTVFREGPNSHILWCSCWVLPWHYRVEKAVLLVVVSNRNLFCEQYKRYH